MLGWLRVLQLQHIVNNQNTRWEHRRPAIRALGKTHSRWAISLLTDVVHNDEGPIERLIAAEALGELGIRDPRCVSALLEIFRSSDYELIKRGAYDTTFVALTKLGWLPDTQAESERVDRIHKLEAERERKAEREKMIRVWIRQNDKQNILTNWDECKDVLLTDLFSLQTQSGIAKFVDRKAVDAAGTLIRLGREEYVESLVDLLTRGESQLSLLTGMPDPGKSRLDFVDREERKLLAEMFLNCGHEGLAAAATGWARRNRYSISKTTNLTQVGWGSM